MNRSLTWAAFFSLLKQLWKESMPIFLFPRFCQSRLPLPLSCWKLAGTVFPCPALLIPTSRPRGITSHPLLPGTSLTKPLPIPLLTGSLGVGLAEGLPSPPHLCCSHRNTHFCPALSPGEYLSLVFFPAPSPQPPSKVWPPSPAL